MVRKIPTSRCESPIQNPFRCEEHKGNATTLRKPSLKTEVVFGDRVADTIGRFTGGTAEGRARVIPLRWRLPRPDPRH